MVGDLTRVRKAMMACMVIVVVALMILLIIGYAQPLSRIRVKVYNVWTTEVSIAIYIDNVTDGQVYHLSSYAMKVLGVWSVYPGHHNVSLVSDDFPKMVYNTKVLSRSVFVWPYETTTAYWGLAEI